MNASYSFSIRLQRLWLLSFLAVIPFSTAYIVNTSVAVSYINVFSMVFIGLGLFNALKGDIPFVKVKDREAVWTVLFLVAAMAYGLIFSEPLRSGLGFFISRLSQPLLVGWFAYHMLEAKALKVEEMVKALLVSLGLLIIGGLFQIGGVLPFLDPGRVTVLYRWPNTFARYVEILLLISLPFIWFKSEKNRIILFILWITGIGLLLSTLSYNAVAGTTVAGLLFLILLPSQYRKIQVTLLAIMVVVIGVAAINAPRLPKWERSVNDSKETRLEFWQIAVATIKDNPLTGIGLKGWELRYPELLERYDEGRHLSLTSQQPHNVFLDSLLKAGPIGLLAVLAILLWPIRRGYQIMKASPMNKEGWFGLSLLLYGMGMMLFGLIDDPLWSDDTMPLLAIFLFSAAYWYKKLRTGRLEENR